MYNTDAEGKYLNPEKLFYNIYFDGEKQTLSTSDYQLFKKDMTDIPYEYSDNYDIQYNGDDHKIYFYKSDIKQFGVQLVYTGGNEIHSSDIVYWDIASGAPVTDGISDVNASNSEKNKVYYDLSGRKVTNPSNGIFIMKCGKTVKKVVLK